ncbi:MAG: spermidine synthase [Paraglaciecola sp.]|jgi:spermidine synthase
MIPWTILGTANIPNNGGELKLTRRENEFSIHLTGIRGELMNSRTHSSELALAELGCAHILGAENCKVLVGGLGMGFTLSAALKATTSSSEVVVAELIPEVIEWNKGPLGECANRPLNDSRVQVHLGDVAGLFKSQNATYDSVLLDVDNGPEGFTNADNNNLYSLQSLLAIRQTLHPGGVLAVWSAWNDPKFSIQLKKAGFAVETKTVRAHKGKGSCHTIYLARKAVDAGKKGQGTRSR